MEVECCYVCELQQITVWPSRQHFLMTKVNLPHKQRLLEQRQTTQFFLFDVRLMISFAVCLLNTFHLVKSAHIFVTDLDSSSRDFFCEIVLAGYRLLCSSKL